MITIVGLGVIGGSYALALKEAGIPEVYGVDTDLQTITMAHAAGAILEGDTDATRYLPESDMVILAIYPKAVIPFLKRYAHLMKPGAVLTDATGIKTAIIDQILPLLPEGVDYVPGHPMAGREKKGFAFASATVFKSANYLLTPLPTNTPEHIDQIEQLALKMGFRRVKRISAQLHDEMIAYTSQLPHAMAVALVNSDIEGRDTGKFIGNSYRDLTRIARINSSLWTELFFENRDQLLPALDRFLSEMNAIRDAVAAHDSDALMAKFDESTRRREALDD